MSKVPFISGNLERKGINKNKQIHALDSLQGAGGGREGRGDGWEPKREEREGEERERESGDRERAGGDQLNKKTGTSIKRQNGKELEYQNQRSIKERRTLRKCTNRNTEAENESWAKGRVRKKGQEGREREHDRDRSTRRDTGRVGRASSGPHVAVPRGPRQC